MFSSEKRVGVEEQCDSKIRPILTRETKCIHNLRAFFVQPDLMKRCKDSQIYSINACRMTTSKIYTFRWDQALSSASDTPSDVILEGLYKSKELQDTVQLQTVLALYDQETVRNNGNIILIRWWELETSGSGAMLWKGDHSPRVSEGQKAYVERKNGRVFSAEGTWTMFQSKLMQFQSWPHSLWQQWQRSETKRDDRLLLHIPFEGKTDWRRETEILTRIRQWRGKLFGQEWNSMPI